jgi:hypothetical protein
MIDRSAGIGHLAARTLIEEISLLRDEIHEQGILLQNIDIAMAAIYRELHQGFRPHYLRPEE